MSSKNQNKIRQKLDKAYNALYNWAKKIKNIWSSLL